MNNLECPACGSEKIKDLNITEVRQLTLGSEFSYQIPIHACEVCGEEGDFNGKADGIRELAMANARVNLAKDLISSISETGMKLAYIERAFEIPQRTISSKWGSGKVSASGLALLRIVKSMPWIVHIADNKFDRKEIRSTVQLVWGNMLRDHKIPLTYSTTEGPLTSINVEFILGNDRNKLTGTGQTITSTVE